MATAELGATQAADGLWVGVDEAAGLFHRPSCAGAGSQGRRSLPDAVCGLALGCFPCPQCRPESAPWVRRQDPLLVRALVRLQGSVWLGESATAFAAALGTSVSALESCFQAAFGLAFAEYARWEQVLWTARLLGDSDLSLEDVARASGFSLEQLQAVAEAHLGASPLAYRLARRSTAAQMAAGQVRLRLGYRPPYDWGLVLGFLRGRQIPGVERFEEDRYAATFRFGGACGWFEVAHLPEDCCFSVTIQLDRLEVLRLVVQRIRRLLDLDADGEAIRGVLGKDPLLGPLLEKRPGVRLPGSREPFEFSIRAVLGQQISVRAATTLAGRIATRYGVPTLRFPPGLDAFFPNAQELREARFEGIGLTQTRAQTLQTLVAAVADGALALHADHGVKLFESAFCQFKGLGPWTASYVAMRGLGEPDAFPEADLGVLKGLTIGEQRITPKAALARAEVWRPFRAYAAILLWTQDPPAT